MIEHSPHYVDASHLHDLWRAVTEHPDFAGGRIWIREDIAVALYNSQAEYPWDVSPEQHAAVTDDMVCQSRRVIDNWIDADGGYGWMDAMQDLIEY